MRIHSKVCVMLFPNGDIHAGSRTIPRGYIGDIPDAYSKDPIFDALRADGELMVIESRDDQIKAEISDEKPIRDKRGRKKDEALKENPDELDDDETPDGNDGE